jgi:hypothetical protein
MNEFVLKDVDFSSELLCLGCELRSHERADVIAMFAFVRVADLEKLVGRYFFAKASVNSLKHDEAMKVPRNLIMEPKPAYERTLSIRVTA